MLDVKDETIAKNDDITADNFVLKVEFSHDGNAKVTQDHCSDYVLLTEKVAEAPKTGDNTNFALWIAVLGLGVVAIAGSVVMKKREF